MSLLLKTRFAISLTSVLLVTSPAVALPSTTIRDCYDGDTCRTTTGERIRMACIDTPELRGKRPDPVPAKAARDHLRSLVAGRQVGIRRITTERHGRTVAELFADGSSVQQRLVASCHAEI